MISAMSFSRSSSDCAIFRARGFRHWPITYPAAYDSSEPEWKLVRPDSTRLKRTGILEPMSSPPQCGCPGPRLSSESNVLGLRSPQPLSSFIPFRPFNIEVTMDWSNFFEIVGKAVSIIAAVAGGWWAVQKWRKRDEHFPRIYLEVTANFLDRWNGEIVVELVSTLENKGVVPLKISDFTFKLLGLKQSDNLVRGTSAIRGQLNFPHAREPGPECAQGPNRPRCDLMTWRAVTVRPSPVCRSGEARGAARQDLC